jgi:AcrB/AcrD/AcrF family
MRTTHPSCLAISLMFMLVTLGGCKPKGAPIVRITISAPGHSAEMADSSLAYLITRSLFAIASAYQTTAISRYGSTDVYLTFSPGESVQSAISQISKNLVNAKRQLPVDASILKVSAISGPVPTVIPAQVDVQEVQLDAHKLSAAGVLVSDVEVLLSKTKFDPLKPPTEESLAAIRKLELPNTNPPLTLDDVATVRVVKKPDAVVQRW